MKTLLICFVPITNFDREGNLAVFTSLAEIFVKFVSKVYHTCVKQQFDTNLTIHQMGFDINLIVSNMGQIHLKFDSLCQNYVKHTRSTKCVKIISNQTLIFFSFLPIEMCQIYIKSHLNFFLPIEMCKIYIKCDTRIAYTCCGIFPTGTT